MNAKEKVYLNFLLENAPLEEIEKKYKQNFITKEKTDLFKAFTLRLGDYIFDTYLGREFIKTKEDIEGHLRWCINTTVKEFESSGFYFKLTQEMYDYFFTHFEDSIYNPIDDFTYTKKINTTYLNKIFLYEDFTSKKRVDLDTLVEYYNILNKSFTRDFEPIQIVKKRTLQNSK